MCCLFLIVVFLCSKANYYGKYFERLFLFNMDFRRQK